MKKTIFIGLAALCLSATLMAQEENDNALRINFTGTGNPIETEHLLVGTHITFSEDGREMNLTVNEATATYDLSHVSGMTHFNGTPTVQLHANEDPTEGQQGKYYTTFYSGLEAYTIPNGVKAYTAELSDNNIILTSIEGNVLPQGEAVLLFSNTLADGDWTMEIADGSSVSKYVNNQFDGVDITIEQDGNNFYMLSYGQYNLNFYKMNSNMALSANKAFITLSSSAQAKAFRMVFPDEMLGGENGIEGVNENKNENENIYSVSGIRQNKLQKGINIVRSASGRLQGKNVKIVVK